MNSGWLEVGEIGQLDESSEDSLLLFSGETRRLIPKAAAPRKENLVHYYNEPCEQALIQYSLAHQDESPKSWHSGSYFIFGRFMRVWVCQVDQRDKDTLKMMDWPPQSPDLNPIEQIWAELENKLDRSIVHSKESLWLELQKAWDKISVEVLRKYIDTMPERCAAVIAAKGGHTKY